VSIGKDPYVHSIKINLKGRKVLGPAIPCWEKAQTRIVKSLGADTWKKILLYLEESSMIVGEETSDPPTTTSR